VTHRIRWQDLRIGTLATAVVLVVAISILVFGRVGRLRGDKFTLHVTTDAARGIIRGSEVWLDGQKVGQVKNVVFQPAGVSRTDRLVVTLSVLESARSHVRRDSRVQVRTGGSIIGDQVVHLSSGTATARQVASGDTIHAGEQTDLETVAGNAIEATREFPAIIANVKLLAAQLHAAEGTIGAFTADKGGPGLDRVRAKAARLMNRISDSRGTIGLAFDGSSALRERATHAMAVSDSIRTLLASDQHTLGRFRRDSTLKLDIARARDELKAVARLAASPTGTIGRLRSDSAITRNIHRDLAAMDSLFADIKKHPLRYIAF